MPSSTPPSDFASPGAERRRLLPRLARSRSACIGVVFLGLVSLMALLAPWIATHDPLAMSPRQVLRPPSVANPFGTDQFGRDVWSRVVFGGRISLWLGFISVGIAVTLGGLLGLVAGLYPGRIAGPIEWGTEVLLAFPGILLTLAVSAILGPGLVQAMVAVGLSAVPFYVRLVRATTLAVTAEAYIEAARALGGRDLRIALRHVLPNIAGPLMVFISIGLGTAVLTGSALTFLGLGAQPPTPEWGGILSEGRNYMRQAWWITLFPGVAIMLTVLGFNMLGDGLRDTLDATLRG
jgi:ABC-type dipeptide/oligopeptide/nickel transport system permease subunit